MRWGEINHQRTGIADINNVKDIYMPNSAILPRPETWTIQCQIQPPKLDARYTRKVSLRLHKSETQHTSEGKGLRAPP